MLRFLKVIIVGTLLFIVGLVGLIATFCGLLDRSPLEVLGSMAVTMLICFFLVKFMIYDSTKKDDQQKITNTTENSGTKNNEE